MIAALVILAVVLLALLAAGVADRVEHRRTVQHMLAAQDGERWSWARERWDLVTRLQSPEVARYAPPPPPPPPHAPSTQRPAEPLPFDDDDEPDESHLVGTVIGHGAEG